MFRLNKLTLISIYSVDTLYGLVKTQVAWRWKVYKNKKIINNQVWRHD